MRAARTRQRRRRQRLQRREQRMLPADGPEPRRQLALQLPQLLLIQLQGDGLAQRRGPACAGQRTSCVRWPPGSVAPPMYVKIMRAVHGCGRDIFLAAAPYIKSLLMQQRAEPNALGS
jgi:hypothetical protein